MTGLRRVRRRVRSRPATNVAAGHAAVVETHSAVVFFVGAHVHKLKKAVDLGFLDFTSVAARKAACEREVELNRRLAADVYLGVSTILDPRGEVCDHLVTMRRLPDDRRLSACLERGEPVDAALREIAGQLAALHAASSTPPPTGVATAASLRALWASCLDVLTADRSTPAQQHEVQRIEELAFRYLDGRTTLFDARIAGGQVRDGHGDLQCADIFVLDDGVRILDCLDFDDDLRWGDVLADVAFLAMDLERRGHPDLAGRFLADYRELTGTSWPPSLAHYHIAYRALVRAKVAALRGRQTGRMPAELRTLRSLSLEHLEAGRVRLVLVGGSPGTGKSTVAEALGRATGGVVLRSDVLRRDVSGFDDRYAPEAIAATYRKLLEEAEPLLARGEHVILDASWSHADQRERARSLGRRSGADLVELRCCAPLDVCLERVARRHAEGRDASEAGPEVAADMAHRFPRWPRAAEIPTDRDLDAVLHDALRACGWTSGWPDGMGPSALPESARS